MLGRVSGQLLGPLGLLQPPLEAAPVNLGGQADVGVLQLPEAQEEVHEHLGDWEGDEAQLLGEVLLKLVLVGEQGHNLVHQIADEVLVQGVGEVGHAGVGGDGGQWLLLHELVSGALCNSQGGKGRYVMPLLMS